ncbi:S8 family serine peptidase [Teichococcus aestuarii]|uniref:S8 family serine peptidase n=1 Tax=Teichococcus aestuarii TaxID=568898 RepID=UPI003624248A
MARSFNDPGYAAQWELQDGTGINATPLYAQYTGAGIRIGIVDAGVNYALRDLGGQMDVAADYDALEGDDDASTTSGDQHGTTVALIIGARANNGIGDIGAAFGARLVAYRFDTRDARTVAQETALLALQHQVDISQNSWSRSGEYFRDDFGSAEYAGAAAAILHAASAGRGGLGTVIVRSAGNNGATGDDVNSHSYLNNRHSIAVGATDSTGAVQPFSNPGAALLVVAPASATSWAAPLVSATVALMLEANPALGYRDVQTILALSARVTDAAGAGWLVNAGTGWNGGGLHVSRGAGFGLVDAQAAVRLAESWRTAPATEASLHTASATSGGVLDLPDLGTASQGVTIEDDLLVERAEISVDLLHARPGQLRITLVSPGGTESVLLDQLGLGRYKEVDGHLVFTFSSVQFLWEQARGEWTLRVEDLAAGTGGRLASWSLTLYGAPASDDTVHVFTDEYAAQVAADPGRTLLQDDAGTDTLNAAAVTTASLIDLSPGGASRIAGQVLVLAPGTRIENADGGDGGDTLIGNAAANRLDGHRGNDTLRGMAGDDTLIGGEGEDRLDGGSGNDLMAGGAGNDTYIVDSTGDRIEERTGEGLDTVEASVSHVLSAGVEWLRLMGAERLNGTGNAGENVLIGNEANNVLDGGAGDDWLLGRGGDDTLIGGAGNDRLDGGAGRNRLAGGPGDDLYLIAAAGNEVVEKAGEGTDTVQSWASFVLPAHVEHLQLMGNAKIHGTGNSLANTIAGNAQNNIIIAGAGDDTVHGMAGHDTLDGGAGADRLEGGMGDDIYIVDDNGDLVVERPGEGLDAVRSWISHILAANVEQLRLMGEQALDGAGNAGNNILYGNAAGNILSGEDGDDILYGEGGNDTLFGGAGNDQFHGGAGTNQMIGGLGDDIFHVAHSKDSVMENAGEGWDTVQSWISHTLPEAVEALVLRGSQPLRGTGNALDNLILGNAQANRLSGGGGNDTLDGGHGPDILTGGSGADRFILQAGQGTDHITDFRPAEGDVVVLQGFPPAAADGWPAGYWLQQAGADVLLQDASGTALVLDGIQLSALSAQDFLLG